MYGRLILAPPLSMRDKAERSAIIDDSQVAQRLYPDRLGKGEAGVTALVRRQVHRSGAQFAACSELPLLASSRLPGCWRPVAWQRPSLP